VTFTLRSLLYMVLGLAVALGAHFWLDHYLEIYFSPSEIIWAYVANALLTAGVIAWLLNLPEKYTNSLGFFFLYGSFAKAIMFFAFFYPGYRADGSVSRPEFSAFFVPYAVCLIVETSALIIKLKQSDTR